MAKGLIKFPQKTISLDDCDSRWVQEYLTLTLTSDTIEKPLEPPFAFYRLSYMYYTALGTVTAILVGVLVSWLSGCNKNKTIHIDLFSPIIHRFIKQNDCDVVDNNKQTDCNNSNEIQLRNMKS